jgi:ADP-ribose pyrophosphatase
VKRETLYTTKWIGLHRIDHWDFIERPNAAACVGILAVTDDDEVVLVEQFRIPVQQRVIEIPAGLLGDEPAHQGETIAAAAGRELLEETGFRATAVTPLLSSPTSAGMTSEFTHLFLATGLVREHQGGGTGNEDIAVHLVPCDQVRSWLHRQQQERGVAVDFKIHAALWAAAL